MPQPIAGVASETEMQSLRWAGVAAALNRGASNTWGDPGEWTMNGDKGRGKTLPARLFGDDRERLSLNPELSHSIP